MDVIYDNIDNYNEVNLVQELKHENKELKIKLDEYSSAMVKLQKDFDKLNNEHKKLEYNYSSLLKTAKAEIERKTNLITQLNIEKDKLVIQSIQKTGRNILKRQTNYYKPVDKVKNLSKANSDLSKENWSKDNKNVGGENDLKRHEDEGDILSTIDSSSGVSTVKTTSIESVVNTKYKSTIKENISKDQPCKRSKSPHEVESKVTAGKMTNRRKSMPVPSDVINKFSSDDIDDILKDIPIKYKEFEKQHLEPRYSSRKRKGEEYDVPLRDKKNKRDRRYYDYGHDMYNRQSPERDRHRISRAMQEEYEYSNRSETRRHRSPKSDKYHRSKSRDRWRADQHDPRDFDNYDYYPKHRKSVVEDQHFKKLRTDSYSAEIELERRSSNNREDNIYLMDHPMDNLTSCQSPDYDHHLDNQNHHFVKEIKGTATMKLEDPRITSRKYVLHKEEEKVCLTRASFEEVNVKFIDKTVWGIENIDIPEALKTNHLANSNLDKEMLQFDNSVLNLSLEPGEMNSFDNYLNPKPRVLKENTFPQKKEVKYLKIESKPVIKIQDPLKHTENTNVPTKYKIPKIKKSEEKKLPEMMSKTKSPKRENVETKSDKVHDKQIPKDPKPIFSKNEQNKTLVELNIHNKTNFTETSLEKIIVEDVNLNKNVHSVKNCIEGDLELSDEGSDWETPKEVEPKKINKISDQSLPIHCDNKTKTNLSNPRISEEINNDNEILSVINKNCKNSVPNTVSDEKIKESDSKKKSIKHSTKESKKNKNKDISLKNIAPDVGKFEVKNKSNKKCKESKIDKHKFTELFGDSSSLITPDDLGIPNTQAVVHKCSVDENTQNAVDINLEEVKKSQQEISVNTKVESIIENKNDNDSLGSKEKLDNDTINTKKDQKTRQNDIINTKKDPLNAPESLSTVPTDNTVNSDKPVSTLYANLNSGSCTDYSVKSIIISTGVQPHWTTENTDSKEAQPPITENIDQTIARNHALESMEAVATSTPYKPQTILPSETSGNSQSGSEIKDNMDSNLSQDSNSTKECDKPDVTIFVKKRRKYKKPTWV